MSSLFMAMPIFLNQAELSASKVDIALLEGT
jgi:hypothetical protein